MSAAQRTMCPLCGRGERDKTLIIFDTGRVHCHRGCGWREIKSALRDAGGLDEQPKRQQTMAPAGQRWSATAQLIWDRALPLSLHDVVCRYLKQRNCVIPECHDLRILPATERYPWPCMVARITDAATCEPLSLHMTRLDTRGQGKAPIDRPRTLLKGHVKQGGVIRLYRDEDVTSGIAITEGVETALAVAHVHRPIWSCVDAGNLASFPVLPGIEAITIYADADEAGRKAAEQCAERWHGAGREVWIAEPPVGDWNDRVQEVAA